jgi:hypothetical protein
LSSYADKISEFNKRIADIATKLAGLSDKRKEYAYAAASGDTRARKALDDASFEEASLVREQQVLHSACETAQALERQHELEEQAAEEHSRQVEAHKCAQAVAAFNVELDGMLLQLRECFERRLIALRSLSNTATVDPNLIMRLSNKAGPTSAAHSAGLGRHLNLDMVPVVSQRPLADSNTVLLGIGEPPSKPNGKGNGKPNGRGKAA